MKPSSVIGYRFPQEWIKYDLISVATALIEAKTAVAVLVSTPYQRNWVEALQQMQLKREIAGTSRIEGADFTERELDMALRPDATPQELATRSQRQAHAAMRAYGWIAALPNGQPLDGDLVREIHRRIVTGCDTDHCEPGALRQKDYNVTFGLPPHRGCEGGELCQKAFDQLIHALQHEYNGHDLLVQALAFHYHFAAMHPFMDGNGRTARALEALMLQRAGLTDRAFIAMSNYYYDEKNSYLATLAEVRSGEHDLTPFLLFGLKGITLQCRRLYDEIKKHMERALFRNMMYDLFNRLQSTRKRVIKDRQIELLKVLLEVDKMDWHQFTERVSANYKSLKSQSKIYLSDVASLYGLGAIQIARVAENKWEISIRPQWPQEITESEFFEKIKKMPKGKTYNFLP